MLSGCAKGIIVGPYDKSLTIEEKGEHGKVTKEEHMKGFGLLFPPASEEHTTTVVTAPPAATYPPPGYTYAPPAPPMTFQATPYGYVPVPTNQWTPAFVPPLYGTPRFWFGLNLGDWDCDRGHRHHHR